MTFCKLTSQAGKCFTCLASKIYFEFATFWKACVQLELIERPGQANSCLLSEKVHTGGNYEFRVGDYNVPGDYYKRGQQNINQLCWQPLIASTYLYMVISFKNTISLHFFLFLVIFLNFHFDSFIFEREKDSEMRKVGTL